jgi:hypothetical protein
VTRSYGRQPRIVLRDKRSGKRLRRPAGSVPAARLSGTRHNVHQHQTEQYIARRRGSLLCLWTQSAPASLQKYIDRDTPADLARQKVCGEHRSTRCGTVRRASQNILYAADSDSVDHLESAGRESVRVRSPPAPQRLETPDRLPHPPCHRQCRALLSQESPSCCASESPATFNDSQHARVLAAIQRSARGFRLSTCAIGHRVPQRIWPCFRWRLEWKAVIYDESIYTNLPEVIP